MRTPRALGLLTVLLAGCAPSSYRLQPGGLVPPGVRHANAAQASWTGPNGCRATLAEHGVELRNGQIRVSRDALSTAPAGWLNDLAARLQGDGCLAPGQGAALAERIANSVPLPAGTAHRLQHWNPATTGYLDLRPGYRLRVTSPVLRAGAPVTAPAIESVRAAPGGGLTVDVKASSDLLGYEVAWYQVTRQGLRSLGAETHLQGVTEKSAQSRFAYFPFAPGALLLRSLVLTRSSAQDRDSLVLAASAESELEAATRALNRDPASCRGDRCVVLPRQVALTAFIVVTVNGAEKLLAPGATVREATGGKLPARVWKPHGARLVPVVFAGDAVLALPLAGGEKIES